MLATHLVVLIVVLILLILLSAFFSGSETGMISINRYRLRHLAKKNHPAAQRVEKLLARPDRILGVILIGNTFANTLAAAIATMLAVHWIGEVGALLATILLTIILLIFSETAPKTFAVMHPERVAYPASRVLQWFLYVLYPVVWLVNTVVNALLKCLRVPFQGRALEPLNSEELRSIVNEATGKISASYQEILLRILDLECETVSDAMIPRNEIYGIDVEQPWDKIVERLFNCPHRYAPLYCERLDQVIGMISMRKVLKRLAFNQLSKHELMQLAEDIYFIPETAPLSKQLLYFQQQEKYVGMVVDEYGDIQGIICLKDIMEEIVGEFEQGFRQGGEAIQPKPDGSYLLDGAINLRELNRIMGWEFPISGPKTLSGLMIEYLESMPTSRLCMRIAGYPIEVIKLHRKTIQTVRVWPNQRMIQ